MEADEGQKPQDIEAAHVAQKIRELVNSGEKIYDKHTKTERPCAYGDFAVLQRSYSNQHFLEKQLKLFGIPFRADRPAALWNDAPLNDLYALLKIIVHPADRIAYGTVLRSPLVRLSDGAFTVCMLHGGKVPFDEALDEKLPPDDLELHREGRKLYQELVEDSRSLSSADLLTKLWYEKGYRYETLWSASSQVYGDLYDIFFELARSMDKRGKGLGDFLDHLADLINKEEKSDDLDLPDEGIEGVRLMSIHKSKGLEFPVVFLFGCESPENTKSDTSLALYSERWGLSLNLPQAEEMPSGCKNYFSIAEKDEEKRKTEAELKRLLYVAMTRAESRLFATAVLRTRAEKEKKKFNAETFGGFDAPEYIKERLFQLGEQKMDSVHFLRLLLPALNGAGELPFTINTIYPYTQEQLRGLAARSAQNAAEPDVSMDEAVARAQVFYEQTPAFPQSPAVPLSINASSLHAPFQSTAPAPDEIDELLEKAGLAPEEFGTIVHSFIEGRYNGSGEKIPPHFLAKISESQLVPLNALTHSMTDSFFSSRLGRLSMSSPFRETEFPVLTAVKTPGTKAAAYTVTVSGKIDLLFDGGDALYIVDFKTDKVEDNRRHIAQLAIYERAVSDIFERPVRCWLFYLRSGRELELSGEVKKTSPEELVKFHENHQ
jgi:ATP-dependent helicase/nuclease subunit A